MFASILQLQYQINRQASLSHMSKIHIKYIMATIININHADIQSQFLKLNRKVSMAQSNTRIKQIKAQKTNITSSLDINKQQNKLAAVTRQRGIANSKYIYRLQIYHLPSLQKLDSIDLYQSYSEKEHFVRYIDKQRLLVTTKYKVLIYRDTGSNLEVEYEKLHERQNIYGACVSPDQRYFGIVSDQSLLVWETNSYDIINFQIQLRLGRHCDFAPNNKYIGIADTASILVYKFNTLGYPKLDFYVSTPSLESQGVGTVSSFKFNPLNSQQIVVGFSNISPRFLNLNDQNLQYQKINGAKEQPFYKDNYKIVHFMPDGKRVVSSDYKHGVAVWPGSTKSSLYYKDQYLLFDLRPFDDGKKVAGRIWQNIKIFSVQMKCSNGSFAEECPCKDDEYWDKAVLSCKTKKNCLNGYKFSNNLGQCIIKCDQISDAIPFSPQSSSACLCRAGFVWENGSCRFDCAKIPLAMPSNNRNFDCDCQPGKNLIWDTKQKICKCSENFNYNVNSLDQLQPCVCAEGLKRDSDGQCIANCNSTQFADIKGEGSNKMECQCLEESHIYQPVTNIQSGQKKYACRYNCKDANSAYSDFKYDGRCECGESMKWMVLPRNSDTQPNQAKCVLNCGQILNSVPVNQGQQQQDVQKQEKFCECAYNYKWVPQNMQCGRADCDSIKFVNTDKPSTTASCPCVDNFIWNDIQKKCQIDCEKIDKSQSYSPENEHECICQYIFVWDKQESKCTINCSQIWEATNRTDYKTCECNGDRIFNQSKLSCEAANTAEEFFANNPWIWGVLAVGIIFVIVVSICMIRYCKRFATEKNNKQHNKKLKKTLSPKKKRHRKQQGTSTQRMVLNKN